MPPSITQKHIVVSVLAGFLLTVGISAFFASLAQKQTTQSGTSASILGGIVGERAAGEEHIVAPRASCGGSIYGECVQESTACIKNPIGDYSCVHFDTTPCPAGASCMTCSQAQLEQCLRYHPKTTACTIVDRAQNRSTHCSYE